MTIHHTVSILLIVAFVVALSMQWLLMRRMGRSLEQSQRQKLMQYTRRSSTQQETTAQQNENNNNQ